MLPMPATATGSNATHAGKRTRHALCLLLAAHAPIHLTSSKVRGPNMLNEKYLLLPILKVGRLAHIMQRAHLQPFEKLPKAEPTLHHNNIHVVVERPQEVARIPSPVLHIRIQDRATFWKGHT